MLLSELGTETSSNDYNYKPLLLVNCTTFVTSLNFASGNYEIVFTFILKLITAYYLLKKKLNKLENKNKNFVII